ncbi:MAG TPA: amino acid--tRNA ligase-related protein, partial [Nitrospira sp.]|nr:amino acid--tRNA ligase-related protein [Nitrospira sp.]
MSSSVLRGWLLAADAEWLNLRTARGDIKIQIPGDEAVRAGLPDITPQSSVICEVEGDAEDGGYVLGRLSLCHASDPFPLDPGQDQSLDLSVRHLWLRQPKAQHILRARHKILKVIREALEGHGFIGVQTPLTTQSACVCSGSVFEIPYYDQTVALNQSPWMYVDCLINSGMDKVYAVMPSFRKEKEPSAHHLSEIWHIQCDQAWLNQEESMVFEENLVSGIVERVLDDCALELASLGRDLSELERVKPPFERVTYDRAVEMITAAGCQIRWGEDIGGEAQIILADNFDKPFFLVEPPFETTNFFFNRKPGRPEVAMTHDLYVPSSG